MITSGILIYFYEIDGFVEKEGMITIVDDRISPLVPQAVHIKIHRIRHKGIIDQMYASGFDIFDVAPTRGSELKIYLEGLRPGFGWRTKPIFRYALNIDGYEWIGRQEFETWDTDYINQQVYISTKPEQREVPIDLWFIEKETKLLRTMTRSVDQFSIRYDFRTGQWAGDDAFNDSDGYGHFNGTQFELWFSIAQTEADADGIPHWTEVNVLGTDPQVDDSLFDHDNDGVDTSWEYRWGYDPFEYDHHAVLDPDVDGLQNIEEALMEKWTANPFYPEIFIEVDEMHKAPFRLIEIGTAPGRILPIERVRIKRSRLDGWNHIFWEESQQMLMELFNMHGITMHIDDGCMGGGGDKLPFGSGDQMYRFDSGVVAGFYANNFSDDRTGIFRYLCVLHGGGWCAPMDEKNWFDCMTVPSNYVFFKNQLNTALTPRTMRIGRAVQVLHELGHSLGFVKQYCPGVDNSSKKRGEPDYPWLDYVSVMNYDYFRQRHFDYSSGRNGEYDKDDWGLMDLTFFQRPWYNLAGIDYFDRHQY